MNSTKSMKYSITISKYKIDNGAEKVRAVSTVLLGPARLVLNHFERTCTGKRKELFARTKPIIS